MTVECNILRFHEFSFGGTMETPPYKLQVPEYDNLPLSAAIGTYAAKNGEVYVFVNDLWLLLTSESKITQGIF